MMGGGYGSERRPHRRATPPDSDMHFLLPVHWASEPCSDNHLGANPQDRDTMGDRKRTPSHPMTLSPHTDQRPRTGIQRTGIQRTVITLLWIGLTPIIGFILFWTSCALYFSNIPFEPLRLVLGWGYAITFGIAFLFVPKRSRTLRALSISFAAVWIYWTLIPASNDKNWLPEYASLAEARFEGDAVTIHNLRNTAYRSVEDFSVVYEDRSFAMTDVETVDFILSYWDGNKAIAHSMYSFQIKGSEPLCISVESRRDKDTAQSLLGSLFRQTTLIYICASERDLLGSRTKFRGEEVYLYPTNSTPAQAQALLRYLLDNTNGLVERPRFYNMLFENCTTNLIPDGDMVIDPLKLDYRALLNGFADEMAFDAGWLRTDDGFEVTKQRHHINQYVEGEAISADYSKRIRPPLK